MHVSSTVVCASTFNDRGLCQVNVCMEVFTQACPSVCDTWTVQRNGEKFKIDCSWHHFHLNCNYKMSPTETVYSTCVTLSIEHTKPTYHYEPTTKKVHEYNE